MEFEEHLYLEQPFWRLLYKLPTSSLRRAPRGEKREKKEKAKQIGVEAEKGMYSASYIARLCVFSLQKKGEIKAARAPRGTDGEVSLAVEDGYFLFLLE